MPGVGFACGVDFGLRFGFECLLNCFGAIRLYLIFWLICGWWFCVGCFVDWLGYLVGVSGLSVVMFWVCEEFVVLAWSLL